MKRLILSALILPLVSLTGFDRGPSSTESIDVRTGKWPIILEKAGSSYSLQFRDQQVMNGEVLDTLVFEDRVQLQYFDKALVALKKGNNGDIAEFKTYSVKRADKKGKDVWYILRDKYGLTDFQQTEADIISKAIKSW
jgi:hypothetical protein